jgi:hypothetical protein
MFERTGDSSDPRSASTSIGGLIRDPAQRVRGVRFSRNNRELTRIAALEL